MTNTLRTPAAASFTSAANSSTSASSSSGATVSPRVSARNARIVSGRVHTSAKSSPAWAPSRSSCSVCTT